MKGVPWCQLDRRLGLELTKIFFCRDTLLSAGAEAEEIYTSGVMNIDMGLNVRSCEAEVVRTFILEALKLPY
jgi:hypothetical protein